MNGVVLPTALSEAASWRVTDWRTITARTPAAAGGAATVDLGQVGPDEMWLVDHVVVQCPSTSQTTLRLYDTVVDDSRLLDGTPAGNLNVTDYPNGLVVRPSTSLVAQWTKASAGAVGNITVQVRIMRRTT